MPNNGSDIEQEEEKKEDDDIIQLRDIHRMSPHMNNRRSVEREEGQDEKPHYQSHHRRVGSHNVIRISRNSMNNLDPQLQAQIIDSNTTQRRVIYLEDIINSGTRNAIIIGESTRTGSQHGTRQYNFIFVKL